MKLISFSQPDLAKFCPPEFNIKKGCNTIRIGTLYDYRTIENEKLRDAGEGTFTYSINFPKKTRVSNEWISAFQVDNNGSVHIGDMTILGDGFLVKNITLSGSSHNCWIFCVSKSNESAGNVSQTHEDKWLIPHEKINLLRDYLGSLLWSSVTAKDIPAHILENRSLLEIQQNLGLYAEVRDVEYAERSITIADESELPADQIPHLRNSIPFIKPKIFEHEMELRFIFWLTYKNERISIENNTKILSLRPIDSLI